VSEDKSYDIDVATAAEQSSEEDEAQEGMVLEQQEHSSDSAEHEAMHIVDDESVNVDEALEALESSSDEEADAVVDDALDIDSPEEADAAVEATDDEADTADRDQVAVEEEDPYAEFRRELRRKPGKWYVVHSYAGFEKRVKSNIENRRTSLAMEEYLFEVQVPMEDVVEIKNGQRKLVTRVRIPSYVLVRMDLNEDSWSTVRHTPGVTGFVGNAHNPTPLRFEEAFEMLKSTVPAWVVESPACFLLRSTSRWEKPSPSRRAPSQGFPEPLAKSSLKAVSSPCLFRCSNVRPLSNSDSTRSPSSKHRYHGVDMPRTWERTAERRAR